MRERLPAEYGALIDRSTPIRFRFEGRSYQGYAGDTLSTALWANGVKIQGRSFKYHRPRGVWGLAGVDCNVMVEDDAECNIRGDLTPITEGMDVKAVNTVGGVEKDWLHHLERFAAFTPVGFYYKAFHTPKRFFRFYEERLRRVAGLGKLNTKNPMIHTPKDYAFCDVLVIGAGPAGLSAAVAAAEGGAKVMLVDEAPALGGTLQYQFGRDRRAKEALETLCEKVRSLDNIEVRTSTAAVSHDSDYWVGLVDKTRLTKLRARSVIAATGCFEQPAVFRNNDLPGVMLGSAAQRLIYLYGVKPFEQGVVLTANSEGYQTAMDLLGAGAKVAAVADLRPGGETSALAKAVEDAGVTIHKGHTIYEAVPASHKGGIRGITLCALDQGGSPRPETVKTIPCDGAVMSVGWSPADVLLRQAFTCMAYDERVEQFVPKELPKGVFAAGRVNGIYELEGQLQDGACAGNEAAAFVGCEGNEGASRPEPSGPPHSHPYPIVPHPKGKNFVDLDEDVQLKDFQDAFQEGFDRIELMKRYTTVGMGPSQGKHSNLLAARIMARLRGETMAEKQLTTARPYAAPVPLSHLAGKIFTPRRRTAAHVRHEERDAKFMYAGAWLRPEYYPVDGLDAAACTAVECIAEEAKNVRENVGLIDLGTLGKLEISGPDAVAFLERMYTGKFEKLKVGMSRYGVMCDESGIVIDDGITSRMAENRFYVSTTTGGADGIYREMERWAIQWGVNIALVNVTDDFSAVNVAGPKSREVLQTLTEVALSEEQFPYMGFREGTVAGVPARLLRVGFVSELGYEVHVPVDGALVVWDALVEAGKDHRIRPFGVEAQRLLRLEMGHIIIGRDTDALTQPYEVNLAWALKMQKPFFVSQRSVEILKKKTLERQLAGFVLDKAYRGPLPKDCHQIIDRGELAGRVTSVYKSPALGQVIGLAYVKPEQTKAGTKIQIRIDNGAMVEGTIVETPFYKPGNGQ